MTTKNITIHALLNEICEMYPGVFNMNDMLYIEKLELNKVKKIHKRLKNEEMYRCKCKTYVTLHKPENSIEREQELSTSPGNNITRYVLISLLKRYGKKPVPLLKTKISPFEDLSIYTFTIIKKKYGDYCCWDGKFWTSNELVHEIMKLVGRKVICKRRENILMDSSQFSSIDLCALLEIYRIAVQKCMSAHRLHDILNKTTEDAWLFVNNAKSRCKKKTLHKNGVMFNDNVSIEHFQIEEGNNLIPIKPISISKEQLQKLYPNNHVFDIAWINTKNELIRKYYETPNLLRHMVVKEIGLVSAYTRKIAQILEYSDPTKNNGFLLMGS